MNTPSSLNVRAPARATWYLAAGAAGLLALCVHAEPGAVSARTAPWQPHGAFVQGGISSGAHALVAGLVWPWGWHARSVVGSFTGYWELNAGGWRSKGDEPHGRWSAQIGLVPVLRLQPRGAGAGWFVEAGVGVNLIGPTYRARGRRFGSVFNFGEHVGVGRRFGEGQAHELMLRVQHFSNAGIKRPNPGEDFVQVRYLRRF